MAKTGGNGGRYIPNALTLSRAGLALVFPFAASATRLPIVAAALATEYLDGALSRWFRWESELGRLLDPIADKLFCAAVLATFFLEGRLGGFEVAMLGIRDILVAAGALWVVLRGDWQLFRKMKPSFLGKVTTTLQYAAFFSLVFIGRLHPVLLAVSAVAGGLAGAQYLLDFNRGAARA